MKYNDEDYGPVQKAMVKPMILGKATTGVVRGRFNNGFRRVKSFWNDDTNSKEINQI